MRRLPPLLVGLLVMSTLMGVSQSATAHDARSSRQQEECRFKHHGRWTPRKVRRTIRCAASHLHVIGGARLSKRIARCESGFNPRDKNPHSTASGVYQFLRGTWDGLVSGSRAFMRRWDLHRSVFNARANVLLANKIGQHTWSPWAASRGCWA